jgi:hypothetical protein
VLREKRRCAYPGTGLAPACWQLKTEPVITPDRVGLALTTQPAGSSNRDGIAQPTTGQWPDAGMFVGRDLQMTVPGCQLTDALPPDQYSRPGQTDTRSRARMRLPTAQHFLIGSLVYWRFSDLL